MTTLLPSVRIPAIRPAAPLAAEPWNEDPGDALLRHFDRVHRERMVGLPFLNPRLSVVVAACVRHAGDWLAGVVTPWSLQLVLLPGGGNLWRDTASGARQVLQFPVGELVFIGDEGECDLPAFLYCPLIAPVEHITEPEAAVAILRDALDAVLTPSGPVIEETGGGLVSEPVAEPVSSSRRAFLRGRFR